MNKLLTVMAAGVVATFAISSSAKTIYVDDDNYGKSGMDGKTEATAWGTAQEAMEDAADYDEVVFLPGYYDKGTTNMLYTASGTSIDAGVCRMVAKRDYLTIRSRDGRDTVKIVGQRANTSSGCGEGAVRCFAQYARKGIKLKGLTFINGAVMTGTGDIGLKRGSAILSLSGGQYNTYVIDCAVSNCAAQLGIVQNSTVFRTLFTDNEGDCVGRQTQFYSCIFTRNITPDSGCVAASGACAINCTIVGNKSMYGACTNLKKIYNNLIALSYDSVAIKGVVSDGEIANNVTGGVDCVGGDYQVIAPALGDFRIIKGAAAETAGDAKWLDAACFNDISYSYFPKDELYKDFNGKALPTSGACVAGAINDTATPAGGAIRFHGGLMWTRGGTERGVNINGFKHRRAIYAYPTNYPVQWRVEPITVADTDRFNCWATSGAHGFNRFGDTNNVAYMMPPPNPTEVMTNAYSGVTAAQVHWLDPENGNDTTGDGSSENPWRTLQRGANAGGICYCRAGTYGVSDPTKGDVEPTWLTWGKAVVCDYWTSVTFIAVEGKDKTYIEGAASDGGNDPENYPGCGPNAVRLAVVAGDPSVCFKNFTVMNCYTPDLCDGTQSHRQGGVIRAGSASCKIIDCDIVNCSGYEYLLTAAIAIRCRFLNCLGKPTSASVFGCYFGNVKNNSTAPSGNAFFCTSRNSYLSKYNFNCVAMGGTDDTVMRDNFFNGSVGYGYDYYSPNDGYIKANPFFLDVITKGGRIPTRSPAVGAGELPTTANYGKGLYTCSDYTLDGQTLNYTTAGAYHQTVDNAIVFSAPNGGFSVADGGKIITDAEPITLTPTEGERPCIGFTVNGVTNVFDQSFSHTFTAAEIAAASSMIIEAVYGNCWYVSPTGVDEPNGAFADSPFDSFTKAMEKAASGDIVKALPGTYGDGQGTMKQSESASIESRVVVKAGVALESTEGAEQTVIMGKSATEPYHEGCGADAVRCVYLQNGASVKGFTLTGGRTNSGPSTSDKHYTPEYSGAAVWGFSTDACRVSDCIISNNACFRGVGRYARFVRCQFRDNWASYGGGAVGDGSVYDCTVDYCYSIPLYYVSEIVSTTVGPNNKASDRKSAACSIQGLLTNQKIVNSLILGRYAAIGGYSAGSVINTKFAPTNQTKPGEGVMIEGSEFLSEAEYAKYTFDATTLRPTLSSPAVDAAKPEFDTEKAKAIMNDTDALGGQRVYNGTRDLGALDADWRGKYAADIGRRVTVGAASAGVVESANATVTIPAGESIKVVSGTVENRTLSFTVPTEGSVTLTVGGEATVYGEGSHEVEFTAAMMANEVTLASTAGTAEIAGLSGGLSGLMIIVR